MVKKHTTQNKGMCFNQWSREYMEFIDTRWKVLQRRFLFLLNVTSIGFFVIYLIGSLFVVSGISTERDLYEMSCWILGGIAAVFLLWTITLFILPLFPRGQKAFDKLLHYREQIEHDKFLNELEDRIITIEKTLLKNKELLNKISNKLDKHLDDNKRHMNKPISNNIDTGK